MKIYMAAPLFTVAERNWNRELTSWMRRLGHEVFLPQESEENSRGEFNPKAIFDGDVNGLKWCDSVVAWLEAPDPDSGTCWEHGWACANGKIVIGYTTDLRTTSKEGAHLNLMLTQSATCLQFNADAEAGFIALAIDAKLRELNRA